MPSELNTIHHLGDVPWWEAPIPRRWHFCRVQTWGMIGITIYGRCACGALRTGVAGYWTEKNSRRKGQRSNGK